MSPADRRLRRELAIAVLLKLAVLVLLWLLFFRHPAGVPGAEATAVPTLQAVGTGFNEESHR